MLTTPRVLLLAVLLGTVISLTAIDKYDEAGCRDSRSTAPVQSYGSAYARSRGSNYAGPRGTTSAAACDGFLPW